MSNLIDQQENFLTECLAACLALSPALARDFVNFLFADAPPTQIGKLRVLKIDTTPQKILPTDFGRPDILLSAKTFNIIVENKVGDDEGNRHEHQLKGYWNWLKREYRRNHRHPFLFTIVQIPDSTFAPGDHHVRERYTWKRLHDRLRQFSYSHSGSAHDEVSKNLATQLCTYMESEGIVSNYQISDLRNYASGLRAREAVPEILDKVKEKLSFQKFQCATQGYRKNSWLPQLKISHPRWSTVFGKGKNYKIYLWFMIPGMWRWEGPHAFSPELQIWHYEDDHRETLDRVKPKLSRWIPALRKAGFRVFMNAGSHEDEEIFSAARVLEAGRNITRILAARDKDNVSVEKKHLPDEPTLVATLVERIKNLADTVDSLR